MLVALVLVQLGVEHFLPVHHAFDAQVIAHIQISDIASIGGCQGDGFHHPCSMNTRQSDNGQQT